MNKSLLFSYRLCLKQIYKIKPKDKELFNTILSTLRERNIKISKHHANETLLGLVELLQKANSQDKKSIIKVVRIFTNNSHFVNPQLIFRSNLQSNAMIKVKQDIQFQQLNQKDKAYVLNIISKICDKKPIRKYKTVGIFLKSIQSQKQEVKEQTHNFKVNLKSKDNSEWKWAYNQLNYNKNAKIDQIIKQIFDQRIFLV